MLNKWFGGLAFLLQAAVVIAGVAVFSYFDPFDLLTSEKLKLRDTPVSVRSMQQIGELITAEYYGEVIASTMEKVEIEEASMTSEFGDSVEVIHEYFLDALEEIREAAQAGKLNLNRRRQVRLHYQSINQALFSMPWYNTYMQYVLVKLESPGQAFDKKNLGKSLGVVELGNLLKRALENQSTLEGLTFTDLETVFSASLNDINQKKYKKRQLVLLGRGWVKAGFKFDKFTEDNFRYDKDSKRVIFIGMNPQILSATINPWFIPEKGVEGFEFLIVERKAKRDYEVMKRVKQLCLDKLEKQAMDRDIFERATENAQDQLKAFFELLMGEPIKQVSFYNNIFDYTLEEIERGGSVISGEDLFLIERALQKSDSLLANGYIKTEQVEEFMQKIKSLPYQLFDSTKVQGVNPFLKMAYDLGVDGELKLADSTTIDRYRPEALSNRKWFGFWYDGKTDSLQARVDRDFDQALARLRKNIFRIELDSEDLRLLDDPIDSTVNSRFNKLLDEITGPR